MESKGPPFFFFVAQLNGSISHLSCFSLWSNLTCWDWSWNTAGHSCLGFYCHPRKLGKITILTNIFQSGLKPPTSCFFREGFLMTALPPSPGLGNWTHVFLERGPFWKERNHLFQPSIFRWHENFQGHPPKTNLTSWNISKFSIGIQ